MIKRFSYLLPIQSSQKPNVIRQDIIIPVSLMRNLRLQEVCLLAQFL